MKWFDKFIGCAFTCMVRKEYFVELVKILIVKLENLCNMFLNLETWLYHINRHGELWGQ